MQALKNRRNRQHRPLMDRLDQRVVPSADVTLSVTSIGGLSAALSTAASEPSGTTTEIDLATTVVDVTAQDTIPDNTTLNGMGNTLEYTTALSSLTAAGGIEAIENVKIEGSSSVSYTNAIISETDSTFNIENVYVSGFTGSGDDLFFGAGTVTITTLEVNDVTNLVGGVVVFDGIDATNLGAAASSFAINGLDVEYCTAGQSSNTYQTAVAGGDIQAGSTLTLVNSTFDYDTSYGDGAFSITTDYGHAAFNFSDDAFDYNTDDGGATAGLTVYPGTTVNLTNGSTVTGNIAAGTTSATANTGGDGTILGLPSPTPTPTPTPVVSTPALVTATLDISSTHVTRVVRKHSKIVLTETGSVHAKQRQVVDITVTQPLTIRAGSQTITLATDEVIELIGRPEQADNGLLSRIESLLQ